MKINQIQILAENLVEKGLVIETRPPSSRSIGRGLEIEVGNTGPLDNGDVIVENSAAYYLENVRQKRISWLLFDGSIIQIKYRTRRNKIIFHRYGYFPPPFEADLRSTVDADPWGWIESATNVKQLETPRRSSLRFEFDPDAKADDHAAAHIHINTTECRIPMRGPLSAKDFIRFLLKHFYKSKFSDDLCGPPSFECDATISNVEKQTFHLAWQRPEN